MGDGIGDQSKAIIEDMVFRADHGIVLDGAHGFLLVVFSVD